MSSSSRSFFWAPGMYVYIYISSSVRLEEGITAQRNRHLCGLLRFFSSAN